MKVSELIDELSGLDPDAEIAVELNDMLYEPEIAADSLDSLEITILPGEYIGGA